MRTMVRLSVLPMPLSAHDRRRIFFKKTLSAPKLLMALRPAKRAKVPPPLDTVLLDDSLREEMERYTPYIWGRLASFQS